MIYIMNQVANNFILVNILYLLFFKKYTWYLSLKDTDDQLKTFFINKKVLFLIARETVLNKVKSRLLSIKHLEPKPVPEL